MLKKTTKKRSIETHIEGCHHKQILQVWVKKKILAGESFTRWLVGTRQQCCSVSTVLLRANIQTDSIIAFECPQHLYRLLVATNCAHRQKMSFIVTGTFPKFWSKKAKSTTKVTLYEPQINQMGENRG